LKIVSFAENTVVIAVPADHPVASRIVGRTSVNWKSACATPPLRRLPFGQCTTSGVAIPPSCTQRL